MTEVELRKLDDEMVAAYLDNDVERVLSHCASDILMLDFGAEPVQGIDACREYLTGQFSAFSGDKGTHIHRIFGDNQVFGELDWSATHTGDLELPDGSTVPATGKTFKTRIAYYARVNDEGEVAEIRGYQNLMEMMGQLGIMG